MALNQMQENVEQASDLLKTLANPSRLLVLCALVTREHTVGELERLTGLSQSSLSQHLARMRDEEIVATRREAQKIFYSLRKPEVRAILETLYSAGLRVSELVGTNLDDLDLDTTGVAVVVLDHNNLALGLHGSGGVLGKSRHRQGGGAEGGGGQGEFHR